MSTLTAPPSHYDWKTGSRASGRTEGAESFVVVRETRYEQLPASELLRRIGSASLTKEQLSQIIDRTDHGWKDKWLSEPDPCESE